MTPTEPSTRVRDRIKPHNLQIAVISVSVGLSFILLIWAASLSRPIADDYCAAQVLAEEGIWGEIAFGWNETGGAVFQYFVYSLFPGFLMNSLSWSLAGILPMLLPSVILGCGFWLLLLRRGIAESRMPWLTCWTAGLVAIGWFAIWTINGLFSTLVRAPVGASSIEDARAAWFGLTSFYLVDANVLMTLGLMFGWFSLIFTKPRWLYLRIILVIILGFATGAAGPQYSAMFLLAVPAVLIAYRYTTGSIGRSQLALILLTLCISVATFIISTRAPGFVERKAASSSGLSLLGIIESISSSLYLWLIRLVSPGMLAALATGVCIGLLLKGRLGQPTWMTGCLLMLASLMAALATGLCHVFIYTAYWHDIPWTIPMYLAMVWFGILLIRAWGRLGSKPRIQHSEADGARLLSLRLESEQQTSEAQQTGGWRTWFVSFLAVLICIIALLQVVHAQSRLEVWNQGPAPQPGGVEDIDNEYFASCWYQWERSKEMPRSGG